jgi:amidase
VHYPVYLLEARQAIYNQLVSSEFKAQITAYLSHTGPGFPKSFADVVAWSNDPARGYRSPEKAYALRYTAALALSLDDPLYLAVKHEQLAATTAAIDGLFAKHALDAIVYPTSPTPASPIVREPAESGGGYGSATSFANQTGYPDLIVPAGVTPDGLPVTISFFGPAWSEPRLLGYGYDFEQETKAIAIPKHTPRLSTDTLRF